MQWPTLSSRELSGPSPAVVGRMGIRAITNSEGLSVCKYPEDLPSISPYGSLAQPRTPPESASGSPRLKLEGHGTSSLSISSLSSSAASTSRMRGLRSSSKPSSLLPNRSQGCSPLPSISRLGGFCTGSTGSTGSKATLRLPNLEDFDQGVEALARYHGPARPSMPTSPLPRLARGLMLPQPLPALHGFLSPEGYPIYQSPESYVHGTVGLDGYPSPPPDGENRHINQKYTTEEGDFIIYAWYDKKLKWQRIKQDLATMFGLTPERTVQGLQAWYYRMNQRIPLWDQDGWLIFDNEDDLEPKYISIKCRERDSQDKPMEPLGLAQRYPERSNHYAWVDSELKRKAQDWATKRALQYRERRERRKRKEQRRLKL